MPTYEYVCDACGNEFEEFQSMSAAPIKKCPRCKKLKVHRKISTGGGIIFKGGGFYETDYRGDAYKKAAEAEKSGGEMKPTETKSGENKSADAKSTEPATPAAAGSDSKAAAPEPASKAEAKPAATKPPVAKSSSAKARKR